MSEPNALAEAVLKAVAAEEKTVPQSLHLKIMKKLQLRKIQQNLRLRLLLKTVNLL